MRNYTFDARNSSFDAVKSAADHTSFTVSAHYFNPKATRVARADADSSAAEPFPALQHASRRSQPVSRLHV